MQTTVGLKDGDSAIIVMPSGDSLTVTAKAVAPIVVPPAPALALPSLPLTDFSAFLVERVMPDGSPALVPGSGAKRTAYDTLTWARSDYGRPGGYERYVAAEDLPRGRWVGAWSFYPWTLFNAALGDGGQTVQNDAANAYIMETQDGGRAGVQVFTGRGSVAPNGGHGTGWVVCDRYPPTGSWAAVIAYLNIDGAMPLNAAWTRWRIEMLPIPFTVFGAAKNITLPCIISEHYNGASIAAAVSMEQSIYAMGWGEVWWAAYGTGARIADFAARVPFGLPWLGPFERQDFVLEDARLWTQVLPISSGEAATVQWPPSGA